MAKSRDERAGHQSCFIQQVHPMKTIIWCCFAAAVDVEESEEKAHKRKRMILSWISFRISWIGHFFYVSIRPEYLPTAFVVIGQYQVSGIKNRISSISHITCFWHKATKKRTRCWAAQTLHTYNFIWGGQQNLVLALTHRSKTIASTPSMQWA